MGAQRPWRGAGCAVGKRRGTMPGRKNNAPTGSAARPRPILPLDHRISIAMTKIMEDEDAAASARVAAGRLLWDVGQAVPAATAAKPAEELEPSELDAEIARLQALVGKT